MRTAKSSSGSFAVMLPSYPHRSDAAPPGRWPGNCVSVVPVRDPIASLARVDADALPRNSPGIFPHNDPRLLYHERSPTDTLHRDVVCGHIHGLPARTLLPVLEQLCIRP